MDKDSPESLVFSHEKAYSGSVSHHSYVGRGHPFPQALGSTDELPK